jgi:hypothetical protein
MPGTPEPNMIDKKQVEATLGEAIDELNEALPERARIGKSSDTVLFGASGQLSSLQTLNLIFIAEQKLRDQLSGEFSLAESLMGGDNVQLPETLGAFADLILKIATAQNAA